MKKRLFLLATAIAGICLFADADHARALAFDESYNFAPPEILSGIESELSDLVGKNGSQLCAPVALAHVFEFLRFHRGAVFSGLGAIADVDGDGETDTPLDRVRYFYHACDTDKHIGTRYRSVVDCMREYISHSNYQSWAFMVGPHAIEAPAGYPLTSVQHVLRIQDLRYYVSRQAAVIMGVGWYRYNPRSKKYERTGGHFINVYGYNHNKSWGEDQIQLISVNSWVDYRDRPPGNNFDRIRMRKIQVPQGPESIPQDTAFELSGPGFNFPHHRAFAEDIFVAFPGRKAVAPQ